jgi:hypothetical protein
VSAPSSAGSAYAHHVASVHEEAAAAIAMGDRGALVTCCC